MNLRTPMTLSIPALLTAALSTATLLSATLATATVATSATCPPATVDRIAGTWEWVRATGGFVGGVYTPADWGYTQQLTFATDGVVIEFRDGIERARSAWILDCSGPVPTLAAAAADPEVMPLGTCAPYDVHFGEEGGVPSLELRVLFCADWYDFTFLSRSPVAIGPMAWGALKSTYR